MPEWYALIAVQVAHPYLSELGRSLALFFFIGFIPGIVSLIYTGPEDYS